MIKINAFNSKGETVDAVDFATELLVLDKGDQAVKDVVVATMNARRAGTGSTLTKGEVAGSGKKPWKQKGTGRARAGYRQSPVWRGGGIALGPKPRDYSVKVNRKVAHLAFCHALSEQINEQKVCVIDSFAVADGKTRTLAALLKQLNVTEPVLLVTAQATLAVERSARNLPKVQVVTAANLDVYSLLAARTVVVAREALDLLVARMRKSEVEA